MAGTLTVDTIQSDSSYASTLNVASKMNFAAGMQIGGQDTTFGGMRNRIINGDMRIDQRNSGAAVTADNSFAVDRFKINNTTDGTFSAQQSTTAPTGFVNSLSVTITAADTSLAATQRLRVQYAIEGNSVSDFGLGTASASTFTLSFYVRSSLTGTFGGSVQNNDADRSYVFTYTINAANTWEQKTVTIPGDTSGTWVTNTSIGLRLNFGLGIGSSYSGTAGSWTSSNNMTATGAISVIGTNGATFYITGVQLEKGSAATAYEYRQYSTELALCQRYCEAGYTDTVGGYVSAAGVSVGSWIPFAVSKRVNTGMSITTSTSAVLSTATGTWTSQASGGSQTSRTVGINSQYNNGWNTLWAGSDPRISGYWWITAEL